MKFAGSTLQIDGESVDLGVRILDAFETDVSIVVLLDPDDTGAFGQVRNLLALTRTGDRLWAAEPPTSSHADRYYAIASRDPLVAYSNQSYGVEIDPRTGQIVLEDLHQVIPRYLAKGRSTRASAPNGHNRRVPPLDDVTGDCDTSGRRPASADVASSRRPLRVVDRQARDS
jgi:hypothetical protein